MVDVAWVQLSEAPRAAQFVAQRAVGGGMVVEVDARLRDTRGIHMMFVIV